MKGLIFTYVAAYGGAAIAVFNPFYGVLVYVCFAILRPEFLWPWSVTSGNYSRIVGFAMLVGWVLRGLGNWQVKRARPFLAALLGLWTWMIISAAAADDQSVAWSYVELHSKILLPVLMGLTL